MDRLSRTLLQVGDRPIDGGILPAGGERHLAGQ
jgi:hypothetical protein